MSELIELKTTTKITAKSTLLKFKHFEFIADGLCNNMEEFIVGLSIARKQRGYTGEFLTDVLYTNFILIYAESPLSVMPVNVPANSFVLGGFEKHYVQISNKA